jgi:hypothetical protein
MNTETTERAIKIIERMKSILKGGPGSGPRPGGGSSSGGSGVSKTAHAASTAAFNAHRGFGPAKAQISAAFLKSQEAFKVAKFLESGKHGGDAAAKLKMEAHKNHAAAARFHKMAAQTISGKLYPKGSGNNASIAKLHLEAMKHHEEASVKYA